MKKLLGQFEMLKLFIKKMGNKYLEKRNLTICQTVEEREWKYDRESIYGDFIRNSILELVSEEIYSKNVSGSIAEVGVYKGGFSRIINVLFPDRKLYLFDTFAGFAERDLEVEYKSKFSSNKAGYLGDTSVNNVKSLLTYPENCIFKIGYFPETAKGITEPFVFVSIDVDLYNPTKEALNFFYPLLTKPGYIFIHDYGIKKFRGTTQAVKEFCSKYEIALLPLSDRGGTAVIMK